MKRLAFFKVYGRTDPRLEQDRYSVWVRSIPLGTFWTGTQCAGRYTSPSYDEALRGLLMQPNRHSDYVTDYDCLMGRDEASIFRDAIVSQIATAVDADPFSIEAIRQREQMYFTRQAAEGERNAQDGRTTQEKIDRMFGVNQDDKVARKRSLERHALAIRNVLDRGGKSFKETAAFIKSLGLE